MNTELIERTLRAALKVEREEAEKAALVASWRGREEEAAKHSHKAEGIEYAIALMADPAYLKKQADFLKEV